MTYLKSMVGAFLLFVLTASASFAEAEQNLTATGLAMRGMDPVSFFSSPAPTAGNFMITAVHEGAIYRFATEENKTAFTAAPAKYLPQYGGYCAMGVKMGKKLDGDPAVFTVVDGKLYLNVAQAVGDKWRPEAAANIKAADEIWTSIKDKNPGSL